MRQAAGDLSLGEVPVAIVQLAAAVDGNAVALQHADPAAQLHELRADLADGTAVRTPELRDGLVVGRQASCQPHHLDIAPRLALEPPAGGDAV